MNSISKVYNDYDKKEANRFDIKCSNTSSTIIQGDSEAGTTFIINSLTLDTSGLMNSSIKLDFTCNVIATDFSGTIKLQVFKVCDNKMLQIPVGPEWIFPEVQSEAAIISFSVFDHYYDDKYCTYTVAATKL